MADKKVSQLTALTGANTAAGDLLYIVDVSEPVAADQSKKITLTEFQAAPVSAGTANGVAYLNASKVLTTGSALVFDGTNLGVGTNAPTWAIVARSASGGGIQIENSSDSNRGGRLTATGSASSGVFFISSTSSGYPLAFGIDGTEQMRLTSTHLEVKGNLGIGTNLPGAKIETSTARAATITSAIFSETGTGAVNDVNKLTLRVQNTLGGATGGAGIGAVLEASASNKTGLSLYYDSGSGTQTEGARLDSSGNLGLGVTPSGSFKLEVANGDASIYGVTVGRGAGAVATNTAVGASALAANTSGEFNVAMGVSALENSTANSNTAVGYQAGLANTTGANLAVFGVQAGYSNTTGFYNSFFGSNSGRSNTTGGNNTAVGSAALYSNTTSSNNTAIGSNALYSNTTASSNTAVGYQAGYSNQTSSFNTLVGYQAGYSQTANGSLAIGYQAGYNTTTGLNTVVGRYQALYNNTTGSQNTVFGNEAMKENTTGSYNTALGEQALKANTTADNNTAVGYQAGYSNTTAADNTFIGRYAGYSGTTGYSNTFVGKNAGYGVITGAGNTFVGSNATSGQGAGQEVTTGSKNTILGGYNGNQGGLDIRTADNYIVLSDGDGNPRQIIDGSGNLGLGVTPSAWGGGGNLVLPSSGTLEFAGANGNITSNAYYNGGWKYAANGYAEYYAQTAGQHQWLTAASGTADDPISFTQAMTLDASGNLLVGTTSAPAKLTIGGSGANRVAMTGSTGTLYVGYDGANDALQVASNTYVTFQTGSGYAERARITSGGYFKASNTGGYDNATGTYHELLNNDASDPVVKLIHFGATDPLGMQIAFTAASPDDNTQYFLQCTDSTAVRCLIYSDGDLANHDGVYGTISDQKLKQDIVDASSQWDDIKAIRFRKYRMKTDVAANPDAPYQLGVIAQELEQTSPGLVDEHPDMEMVEVTDDEGNVTQTQQPTGTTTKTVKSSILLMKAAVALQEAMARIETLEAEVAALKGN